ncbi:hypothetical protein QL093DRAFT_1508106 [Fusarium oxysporum]|nr:hypothetical protein QL093DRAFT_1508106 [Fusarium oxysporum]
MEMAKYKEVAGKSLIGAVYGRIAIPVLAPYHCSLAAPLIDNTCRSPAQHQSPSFNFSPTEPRTTGTAKKVLALGRKNGNGWNWTIQT